MVTGTNGLPGYIPGPPGSTSAIPLCGIGWLTVST